MTSFLLQILQGTAATVTIVPDENRYEMSSGRAEQSKFITTELVYPGHFYYTKQCFALQTLFMCFIHAGPRSLLKKTGIKIYYLHETFY